MLSLAADDNDFIQVPNVASRCRTFREGLQLEFSTNLPLAALHRDQFERPRFILSEMGRFPCKCRYSNILLCHRDPQSTHPANLGRREGEHEEFFHHICPRFGQHIGADRRCLLAPFVRHKKEMDPYVAFSWRYETSIPSRSQHETAQEECHWHHLHCYFS